MKLTFDTEGLRLPVSVALQQLLNERVEGGEYLTESTTALTFNFRDKSYSAESGGWHPVEVCIYLKNKCWHFDYITDFSYQGSVYPELAKEADFDFASGYAFLVYQGDMPLTEVADFYKLWESNFVEYVKMDCFDEIRITAED
jgi:Protein of unknown function (DUF2787)